MDGILANQLEWLLSGNMEGTRFKRQLILLAGCLAEEKLPEEVDRQLTLLSRRVGLEEVFRALLDPLESFLRNVKDPYKPTQDLSGLIAQIEATRQALNDCEPVNQAFLIAWLISRAKERNLLRKIRNSR